MSIFKLPDLGEGLPDAEIHEWFINEGDIVLAYQPLVAMETAKALVDVPSPQNGKIIKIYGKSGDVIKTGAPLVEFAAETTDESNTVVGTLETKAAIREDLFAIENTATYPKATMATRLLAKKLNVDLTTVTPTGAYSVITSDDVKQHAPDSSEFEPLHGVRRAMQISMSQAHQEIVPVSVFDEVDIESWPKNTDLTVRLLRAISYACAQEPALNAWYHDSARKVFTEVNIGLAIDSDAGLFVPVIHNAANLTAEELRHRIDHYKQAVANRSVTSLDMQDATITLSNFGKFAGRFASPIIVPPTVAIIAVGRVYKTAVVSSDGTISAHKTLPLSLSFDHRAVTGGEATRFLRAMMDALT